MSMKLGRTLGLSCGHYTAKEVFDVDKTKEPMQSSYININCVEMLDSIEYYCDTCHAANKAKRINIFLIEREPRLIV